MKHIFFYIREEKEIFSLKKIYMLISHDAIDACVWMNLSNTKYNNRLCKINWLFLTCCDQETQSQNPNRT
jgi:hypothetical protein